MSDRLKELMAYLDALCKLHASGVKVYSEMQEALASIKQEIKK